MRVELLGIPRERAGVADVTLQAATLGELLDVLAGQFPSFAELVAADGLRPSIVANLNGDRFITDRRTPLGDDDCVLILSADAGGQRGPHAVRVSRPLSQNRPIRRPHQPSRAARNDAAA